MFEGKVENIEEGKVFILSGDLTSSSAELPGITLIDAMKNTDNLVLNLT